MNKSGISNNIVKRLGKSGDGIMNVVATRPMKVLQSKVMNYSCYPLQRCYWRLQIAKEMLW